MTNMAVWHIDAAPGWYTKLNQRVWTRLDVTFGLWPVGPGHQAGAVWTTDGWQTVRWTAADWARNVANPYGGQDEIWKVVLHESPSTDPAHFRYALYADDAQGNRYWDNNHGWNYLRTV